MPNIIYIYALVQTGKSLKYARYCGQTSNPKGRLLQHKTLKKSDHNVHKHNWIKSINKDIDMIILEETTKELCDEREVWWTLHLRSLGMDLLNIKIGGKTSRGFKLSPETIAKIIKSTTGQKRTLKSRLLMSKVHIGTKLSQETKNKMSAAKKGKMPKNLKAIQESNKNMTPMQLEHVKIMHQANVGRKRSEETRKKQSESLLGHRVSHETRVKLSASIKKLSQEDVYDIIEKRFILNMEMEQIAKEYQVTRQLIRKVIQNRYFSYIIK